MRFTQDFIEKVRDANNLVEIISQYTELKRTGDRLMGRCPFPDHAEKTASFSVSESKQLYHCFGCKKSGNLFTFLEVFNGMSFREAVEYLAKRASIELPADDPRQRARSDGRDLWLGINKFAGHYFQQQLGHLPENHPALAYARGRGLTAEIVDKFRLGVALDAWEGLVTLLAQKKIALPMAENLGLVRRKKSGSGFFDLFRERLIFPIYSPSDELLGFGGRSYVGQTPKYLNSPETALFSKGRVLYGLHETGRYIRAEDQAIVVEGYMDAIALYAVGVKNVVAILGTAFTAEHAKLLKRYTSNVVMLLDGDNAGQNAAERSLPILLQAGLMARGCFLSGNMDPDDFVKKRGVEALREELARAPELFNLVVSRWLDGYRGSASEKVQFVDRAYPVLKTMENKQLRELYVGEVAQRLDVEIEWLNRAFVAAGRKEKAALVRIEGQIQPTQLRASIAKGQASPHEAEIRPSGEGPSARPSAAPAAPGQALHDSKESDTGGEAGELSSPELRPLVSTKGAPRDEAFVLSLALHNEILLREIFGEREGIGFLGMLSHSGIREVFLQALEMYGQSPEHFDKLAASLASQIDEPGVLTAAIDVLRRPGSTSDANETRTSGRGEDRDAEERRLMAEYVNAIKKRYYDQQLRLLANQLRNQPVGLNQNEKHQEVLEQFMNIQKVRHALDREQS